MDICGVLRRKDDGGKQEAGVNAGRDQRIDKDK